MQMETAKTGVAILISDKREFKQGLQQKTKKKRHYIVIKESIQEKKAIKQSYVKLLQK